MRLKISTAGKLTFGGRFDPLTGELRVGDELVIPHASGGSPPPSPPGIPQNVVATPGDSLADVSWDAVVGATGYNIYIDTVLTFTGWVTTSITASGLTNGVTYSFTVSATNTGGESAQSDPATVTPGAAYNPDTETTFISRIVADDLNALADGDAINNTDDGTPGPGWPARVGANFTSSPWAFGSRPILKKSILGAHSVVRFNGVEATGNNMRANQASSGSDALFVMVGVKRGSANNSGFLTVHKDANSDDTDDNGEFEVYEGTGGAQFCGLYRNGQKALGLHPGVGVPFVFTLRVNGTDSVCYLGDWPSKAVASTGSLASDWIGLAAAHQDGAYKHNSQIDIAEFLACTSIDDTLRGNIGGYCNSTYGTANPWVFIVLGDSISAGDTNWPSLLIADYSAGQLYLENFAVGGHNLDQVAADATAADVYNRITARTSPGKTIVFIWEYVNAKNAGDTDQQIVDKTKLIADLVHAASPSAKVIVATDFHDATCSVDCSGASALMAAQYGGFADAIVDLNLSSLRASCIAFDGGTHINPTDYHLISDAVKPVVDTFL